ncbi:MAG: hypothetical protein ACK5MV_09845 [Aminipila sp.]
MSEKKVRNKFKELIWDYYLTNREIEKQNDQYNKDNPEKGWNKNAKLYLGVIVIGIIAILIKYFFI